MLRQVVRQEKSIGFDIGRLKRRMGYTLAKKLADQLVEELSPYCTRIEIAGSLRRKMADVGDIEIVAMPGDFAEGMLGCILPEAKFIKNGPRYKQIALPEEINLDLFLVRPPAQWGVIFLLRTGPADFSRLAVTRRIQGGLLPSDCAVRFGGVQRNGITMVMPEEEDFLNLIGLPGLAPEKRADVAHRLFEERKW
jgi:DNA polymerase/3'-5' exonuclease PolX